MRRLLALAALLIAGCATAPAGGERNDAAMDWGTLDGAAPIVIAHRGASGHYPEHTLEAYAGAIDFGADVIEPDLVFSRDGVLVARHDRYLSTTTDVADHAEFAARRRVNDDASDAEHRARVDWWVEDFTLAELKTLRARQPFPGRSTAFDGRFEIPTLDETLALVAAKAQEAGRPVGVYPETKHPGFYASKGYRFEGPLLAALKDFGAGRVFIQSFEPEILKRLKGRTKAKLVQLVFEEAPGAGPNIPLAEISGYADGVGPQKSLVLDGAGERTGLPAQAHAAGLLVHVWTLRNEQPNDGVARLKAGGAQAAGGLAAAFAAARRVEARSGDPLAALEEAAALMSLGVDGLFCDHPGMCAGMRAELAAAAK